MAVGNDDDDALREVPKTLRSGLIRDLFCTGLKEGGEGRKLKGRMSESKDGRTEGWRKDGWKEGTRKE